MPGDIGICEMRHKTESAGKKKPHRKGGAEKRFSASEESINHQSRLSFFRIAPLHAKTQSERVIPESGMPALFPLTAGSAVPLVVHHQ